MAKRGDQARYVCTGNLDHLVIAEHDAEFRTAYKKADLVVADGAPVVWLSRIAAHATGGPLPERVAGSDSFGSLLASRASRTSASSSSADFPAPPQKRRRSSSNVIRGPWSRGRTALRSRPSRPRKSRRRSSASFARPHRTSCSSRSARRSRRSGSPRTRTSSACPSRSASAESFEMAAGLRRRAPVWLQESGLEWLYRFAQEPTRLFQRYFMKDLPYLAGAAVRAIVNRLRGPAGLSG